MYFGDIRIPGGKRPLPASRDSSDGYARLRRLTAQRFGVTPNFTAQTGGATQPGKTFLERQMQRRIVIRRRW